MGTMIILGGLPGSGKSTIAKALTRKLGATWLRVDTIEHALTGIGIAREDIGPKGYELAYAIAEDNLRSGQYVIADSVNPIPATREAWRDVAVRSSQPFLEIEVVCSDRAIHQKRVNERQSDPPGFRLPTWEEVLKRDYAPWPDAKLRIDSTRLKPEEAVEAILRVIPMG